MKLKQAMRRYLNSPPRSLGAVGIKRITLGWYDVYQVVYLKPNEKGEHIEVLERVTCLDFINYLVGHATLEEE